MNIQETNIQLKEELKKNVVKKILVETKPVSPLTNYFSEISKLSSYDEVAEKIMQVMEPTLIEELKQKDIYTGILNEETADDGGVIAISGFYFQFLVSIEYLIELIEGKWDYLVIDHHQDIIVFNNEKIRIIQVKTKKGLHETVTDSNLYRSWVQKLFVLNKSFTDKPIKREYEVITNFPITKAKSVQDVETYRHNDDFEHGITDGDFSKKVKEFTIKEGYNLTNDEIEECLKNFKLTSNDPNTYVESIYNKLGSIFDERAKGVKKDIDYLIGHICSKCFFPQQPSVQIIDKEKAEIIKDTLQASIEKGLRDSIEKKDTMYVIDNYVKDFKETYSTSPIATLLNTHIDEFSEILKKHFHEKHTIYNILSKFIEKTYSSEKYNATYKEIINSDVKELLDLIFFIKIHFGGEFIIDNKHNKLLLNNVGADTFNYFKLKDTIDREEAEKEFKNVFASSNIEDQQSLIENRNLKIVFSGKFIDDDFDDEMIIELRFTDSPTEEDIPEIKVDYSLKDQNDSIIIVTPQAKVVNGHTNKVERIIQRRNTYNNIDDLKEKIKKHLGLGSELSNE